MALTQRGINIPVTGQFQDGDDIVDALRAQGLSVDSAIGSAIGAAVMEANTYTDEALADFDPVTFTSAADGVVTFTSQDDSTNVAGLAPAKNLYNPDDPDVVAGHWVVPSSGAIQANATYTVTGFIPVTAGQDYALYRPRSVVFLDSSKTFIPDSGTNNSGLQPVVVTAPAGAAYMRASYATDNTEFQIEAGSSFTEYEPYRLALPTSLTEPVLTAATTTAADLVQATKGTRVRNPIDGFTVPVTIYRSPTGYSAEVDLEALHTRGTGPTIYVDPVNGNSTNDGLTPQTAVDHCSRARDRGASEMILRGGIYTRTQSVLNPNADPSLIVRSYPGERAVLTQGDTTSWTLYAGATYVSAPLSSTGVVIDRTATTPAGLPLVLNMVDSIAEVESTPGSAYYDSDTTLTYVHRADGSAPGTDLLVSRQTYPFNTSGTGDGANGPYSILLDGITLMGGQTARLQDATGNGGSVFLAKNTDFMWASGNGLSVAGFSLAALVGCRAWNNAIDGFNYHGLNGVDGDAVEINCTGRINGRGSSSQNGSTTHEAWRILRVGGVYEFNGGPNVADVNDTESANFGVRASNAWSSGEEFDFTVGARLWLIGCRSQSAGAVRTGTGRVEVEDFTYVGTVGPTLHPYA